ncbi:MAG: hypothetical protein V4692_02575 [Bdellovibrionota bacterium]
MKFITFTFVLFFGAVSFADLQPEAPPSCLKVGAYATYTTRMTDPDRNRSYSKYKVETIATEPSINKVTFKYSTLSLNYEELWERPFDEYNRACETFKRIVEICESAGNVVETIKIPAGTFQTCRIDRNENGLSYTIWLGDVPMGSVRSIYRFANGSKREEFLTSYRK